MLSQIMVYNEFNCLWRIQNFILYRAITTCYYCSLILYILRRKCVSLKGEMWGQLNLEMFLKIRFCNQRQAEENV